MVLSDHLDDVNPMTTFLDVAMKELVISRGDPMALKPLPESGT
jgi:hypothetical protein